MIPTGDYILFYIERVIKALSFLFLFYTNKLRKGEGDLAIREITRSNLPNWCGERGSNTRPSDWLIGASMNWVLSIMDGW